MVREDLEKAGYDREEQYFRKMEQELIERRRRELDAQRAAAQATPEHPASWMQCPKCGGKLAEQKMDTVVVDRCGSCGGVFFDAGELELLLGSQEPKGVMSSLRKLFG
jgi:hypothetical protein